MLRVGLTGGIGSGKTTVSNIFVTLGIPVYYADERAKWLMNNSDELKDQLITTFGQEVFLDNKLNTAYLSTLVFKNQELLIQLNKLVHPCVSKDFTNWCSQQNAPYILKEAAILIESGAAQQVDKIILVTADIDLRIQRIIDRDKTTRDEVQQRINNQMTDEEKIPFADFLIDNNIESSLIIQVQKAHTELINLCQSN